ncbi:MAG: UDP-N-acetylglucosamine 1-carboxyvinyltransferase, partial [Deltaproteobacteria bacterium]
HRIIPDRIETGTFIVASAITRGNVLIKGARVDHLDAILKKVKEAGVEIKQYEDGSLRVLASDRPKAVDVRTAPYPGFPTDMQAQFMALMSIARGLSVITETIFENRFLHVSELKRMGAQIRIQGQNAIVEGVPYLTGAPVMATDLRASASLVLAGLVAEGETLVTEIHHLERGYEGFREKLSELGARIEEIEVDEVA